jgi:hypothetical protein
MKEFQEFPKIARLSRDVIVTEKIDGTNACLYIEGREMLVGSRTRWITPESDNYGFARWAQEHKEELLTIGDGLHSGEWWGSGIQRGYNLKEKRLSLFNVSRFCRYNEVPGILLSNNPKDEPKYQIVLPECVGLVPVLYWGMFDMQAIDAVLKDLALTGSVASKGFMRPEGVVVYHIAGNVGFKKTIEKDEQPKSVCKQKDE